MVTCETIWFAPPLKELPTHHWKVNGRNYLSLDWNRPEVEKAIVDASRELRKTVRRFCRFRVFFRTGNTQDSTQILVGLTADLASARTIAETWHEAFAVGPGIWDARKSTWTR